VIKQLPPVDYYDWNPLEVGNLWIYENYIWEFGNHQFIGYSWEWVNETITLQNGLQYFQIIKRLTNGIKDTLYLRLDSLNAIIYGYSDETGEDLFYEALYAEVGDSICYEYNPVWACQIVQSEEPVNIWGLSTTKRELYPNYSGWVCSHSLVKGIGLSQHGCGDLIGFYSNLIGCVINGTVYGDTSLVSVEDEQPPLATSFKLEQNYPNPFNPNTKIKFTIPSVETTRRVVFTTLKVYDVLGNEIATLVNEELPAGEYEVEFNTNSVEGRNLTSGVYFYQLRVGGPETSLPAGQAGSGQAIIQTKKMILLK
jgi:hypothetical protein